MDEDFRYEGSGEFRGRGRGRGQGRGRGRGQEYGYGFENRNNLGSGRGRGQSRGSIGQSYGRDQYGELMMDKNDDTYEKEEEDSGFIQIGARKRGNFKNNNERYSAQMGRGFENKGDPSRGLKDLKEANSQNSNQKKGNSGYRNFFSKEDLTSLSLSPKKFIVEELLKYRDVANKIQATKYTFFSYRETLNILAKLTEINEKRESMKLIGDFLEAENFSSYTDQFFTQKKDTNSEDFTEDLEKLLKSYDYYIERPDLMSLKCLKISVITDLILNADDYMRSKDFLQLKERFSKLKSSVTQMKVILMKNAYNIANDSRLKIRWGDFDVLIDYKTCDIPPSLDEISHDSKRGTLIDNIIVGSYQSWDLYLNNMFYSLREEFVRSFIDSVKNVREIMKKGIQIESSIIKTFKDLQIYIYDKCIIGDFFPGENGLFLSVKLFPLINGDKRKLLKSKRLMFGSLLLITDDNFQNVLLTTLYNKPREKELLEDKLLNEGYIEVDIRVIDEVKGNIMRTLFNLKDTPPDRLKVFEAQSYFECYIHTLKYIQEITPENLPFEEYLIKVKKDVKAPNYLTKAPKFILDFSFDKKIENIVPQYEGYPEQMPRDNEITVYNILNDREWPRECGSLDQNQYLALKNMLTKQISLVQGPPGTGKTFVGALAVKILLENKSAWNKKNKTPLLVVCQTNHALDQFLNHLLKFTDNITRVGGRSKDTRLQSYNLMEKRKNSKFSAPSTYKVRKLITELRSFQNADIEDAFPELIDIVFDDWINFCYRRRKIRKNNKKPTAKLSAIVNMDFKKDLFHYWKKFDFVPRQLFENIKREIKKEKISRFLELIDRSHNQPNIVIKEEAQAYKKEEKQNPIPSNDIDEEEDDEQAIMMMEENRMIEQGKEDVIFNDSKMKNSNPSSFYLWKDLLEMIRKNKINSWQLTKAEIDILRYGAFISQTENEAFSQKFEDYKQALKKLQDERLHDDLRILEQADIVGMTVSGCSKYTRHLTFLESPITVVEEAAEVLESQIFTVLTKSTEHLILIGDHKQLRPNLKNYSLTIKGFDVSLFERLINNGLDYVSLREQRRMRPEIADFVREAIYNNKYTDHESTREYDNIKGMLDNVFFFNHKNEENSDDKAVGHSKRNPFESEMIVKFVTYLKLQGYESSQITILTMYLGQQFIINNDLKQEKISGVRVCTVDNYQGEENDIIIISLVRSNKYKSAGFTVIENRVNVALSRAKKGMYIFGNFEMLESRSELWANIITKAKQKKVIGSALPLLCETHRIVTDVYTPKDFSKVPEGGCSNRCGHRYPCGHYCKLACHKTSHENRKCPEKCQKKLLCGHICQETCGQLCTDKCFVKNSFIGDCGHKIDISCYEKVDQKLCPFRCEKRLEACGHPCQKLCHEKCSLTKCEVKVDKTFICNHTSSVPCFTSKFECPLPCDKYLPCGHKCPGTCGDCLQGTLHVKCDQKCKRLLLCGHECGDPCSIPCTSCKRPCEYMCCEAKCDLLCGEACYTCKNKCPYNCGDSQCSKDCSEICDREPCNKPCPKKLACGHRCWGLCGEACPDLCKTCKPNKKPYDLVMADDDDSWESCYYSLQCGHIFEFEGLDQYLESKMNNSEGAKSVTYHQCPICKYPITVSGRYQKFIKPIFKIMTGIKSKHLKEEVQSTELSKVKERAQKIIDEFGELTLNGWKFLKETFSRFEIFDSKTTKRFYKTESSNLNNLLELSPKVLELITHLEENSTEKRDNSWDYFRYHIKILAMRVFPKLKDINYSDDYWTAINDKLHSLRSFLLMKINIHRVRESNLPYYKEKENELISSHFKISEELSKEIRIKLESEFTLTKEEKIQIHKALGLTQGHWYACSNGHPYIITECGGANQISRCPECGDKIGGENHQLLPNNRHIGEFDGSSHSAWSNEANNMIGANINFND